MILVVNDANILIDMIKLNILPQFFGLNLQCHTTSFVLFELHDHQQQTLQTFIDSGALMVEELDQADIQALCNLQQEKPQLSEQDCSALYCAQKLNATLLTADKNLRQLAITKNIPVHGHLWVLDALVNRQQLSAQEAVAALQLLREDINPKLGLTDHLCQPFINKWKNQ